MSMSYSSRSSSFSAPNDQRMPKVGQIRCYWSLLSSDLQFVYLDPVLTHHLGEQAYVLVGQSLLRFVHPDEQASARQDLGGVLDSKTLHGSVTRVRFSRLSKVRRDLGYEGPPHPWAEAEKIAIDANYMAVEIVINWAAEDLVLCFIHATADLHPGDNDELNKTEWTNWCGTPIMEKQHIEQLFKRLMICIPRPAVISRVFQILANKPGRPLLMSWPPDQPGEGPTGMDFARLVENVQIGTGLPNGNDAKTSCTRRYRASQVMPSDFRPDESEVESIFIPHGSIIFACHKVTSSPRSTSNSGANMLQPGYNPSNYNMQQQNPPSYYEQQQGSYALPPLSAPNAYNNNSNYMSQPQPQSVESAYSSARWPQGVEQSTAYSNQWGPPSPAQSATSLPASVSSLRSVYPPQQQPQSNNQQWQGGPSSSYIETPNTSQTGYNRSISPNYSPTPREGATGSPTTDVVPPPRRRVSPGSTRDQYTPGGRNGGNRPTGVLKCSSCKATQSPEWRKGPSGKKELCNACGLRYARSRAKKEGNTQAQRRRKDKLIKRDSATPPIASSVGPSYATMRRNYGESSFSSAGSASGSDIYPHSGQHVLNDMTPSPSPPASSMNFVHYAPAGDARQTFNATGGFYSVPSPLSSNPPVVNPHTSQREQQAQQQQQQHHINQLPPLMPYTERPSAYPDRTATYQDRASTYMDRSQSERSAPPYPERASTYTDRMSGYSSDRVSPMLPSASSLVQSPLNSTLPPASFERDRGRERDMRELPPTPLSAEPRHARRSILTHQ